MVFFCITEKDHIRHFGVLLDNLTWHYHIEKVRSKVVKGIWAIARFEKFGKYKSTFECLLQFNIHALKLLHLGLGKCCQNCITTLAYP